MMLLGITGPIGHGKTTFADALAEQVSSVARFESFFVVAEVADAMHAALTDIPDPYDVGQQTLTPTPSNTRNSSCM